MKLGAALLLTVCANGAALNEHDVARAAMVAKINSVPGVTWTAKANARFAGLPVGASRPLLGLKDDASAKFAAAVASGAVKKVEVEGGALPRAFDSQANWPQCAKVIGDIRDQSNCGCCWAFGAASAASDRLCIYSNATYAFPLSAQELCFCASSDGCGGGDLVTPWMYLGSTGLATGAQIADGPFDGMGLCADYTLPHCHHHGPVGNDPYPAEGAPGCPTQHSPLCPRACNDKNATAPYSDFADYRFSFSGLIASPLKVADIQQEIMARGPVEAAFDVYADFENYAGGIYKHVSGDQMGGHAIRIVGWGEENNTLYWKVANSWNPYWGENGYFRIVRGTNECGIEDQVTSSGQDQKWTKGPQSPQA